MKKLYVVFLFIVPVSIFAKMDTLRHYDVVSAQKGAAFNSNLYFEQYASFQPPAPGFIKSIVVTLGGGSDSGSVTLHFYGHEGGTPFPAFQKDLITPIVVRKTAVGNQRIQADLPEPIWIDNNLFFIKADNFDSGVSLIKDNMKYAPFCSSSSGGNYYLQYIKNAQGIYVGNNAFAIDAVMDYTEGLESPHYFQDVTATLGIDTNLSNSCVSWSDINKDDYLDLLVDGVLYKNNGNSTFTDITSKAGLPSSSYITTFMDMNNDGKDDILYLSWANGGNSIYINNGDETFTKNPLDLSLPGSIPISSFSIGDFNNDKYPDLFVGYLWTGTTDSAGQYAEIYYPYHLYQNDEKLGFTDTSSVITPDFLNYPGLGGATPIGTGRCVRGSQFVDYNNDGQLDLYVANYRLMADDLWQNNGDGTFTNVCQNKGIDIDSRGGSGHGTGVDWADYDNDGDMDLLLPQLAHPAYAAQYDHRPTTVFQNNGVPKYDFTDMNPGVNVGIGIQYEETHAGAQWGDLNNDGLLDFVICAFYGCRYTDVYLQKPDHTFELKSFAFGVNNVTAPSDVTLVDYDRDGKLDLACGDNQIDNVAKFRLFKNTSPLYTYYTDINLISTSGNRQGIGAKVEVYAGGNKYTQYQMPYHGALMSKGNRIHFGLENNSSIDSVVVQWPNGTLKTEKFTGIAVNNYNILTEGGNVVIGTNEKTLAYSSLQVAPNPATQNITFTYTLNHSSSVTLNLYSLLGQKLTIFNHQQQREGGQELQWDLKDKQGKKVAAGIYTYQLQTDDWIQTGKVIVQ